jgi:adenylate kinase family enzyme
MKINVVGTSGVGKSTLARRIARQLALPCIEMDRLYWLPQWQGTPDEAFFRQISLRYRRAGLGAGRQL